MKKAFLLLVFFAMLKNGLISQAEQANLLAIWKDSTLIGSNAHNNIYNEIWGYAINNHEYAIIGSTAGTHFIDVTDPTAPVEAFFVRGRSSGANIIHRDYHDYKGFLFVVADEGGTSLQIIDMNQFPDNISVTENDAIFNAHNIFIDATNARLYALGGTVEIFDISSPLNLTHLGSFDNFGEGQFRYFHDGYIQNNIAFLNTGSAGLAIVDFSDLSAPQLINSLTEYPARGYNHSGWVSDDCSTYYFADENHGLDIKTLAINDLCDLEVNSTFNAGAGNPNSIPHNLVVACNYLYVSYYYDGLRVYDISDQSNPQLVRFYDTYSRLNERRYEGAWGVYPFLPSGNILVSDMQFGLHIFEGMGDNCSSTARNNNCLQTQTCNFLSPTNDLSIINTIDISPNPAIQRASLIVNLSTAIDQINVSLIGKDGKEIKDWKYQNLVAGENDFSILLPKSLPEGLYFLSLRSEQFYVTKKLMIGR